VIRRVWLAVAAASAAVVALSPGFSPPNPPNAVLQPLVAGAGRLRGAQALLSWDAVGGVAAIRLAGILLVVRRGRVRRGSGEPWRTVIELGRQGQTASAIGRTAMLPQDAVRIVLAPVGLDCQLPQRKSLRLVSSGPLPSAVERPHNRRSSRGSGEDIAQPGPGAGR